MKSIKKLVSIMLVIVMICTVIPVFAAVDEEKLAVRTGYINDDKVNIRKGPSASYDSLGKLAINTPVTVTGVDFNGTNRTIWYALTAETSSGNITGYVQYNYVTINGSSVKYTAAITRTTSIFSHAGDWNEKLCSAPKGMEITVIGSELDYDGDKWYQVTCISEGKTVAGYAYSGCVQINSYTEETDFEKYLEQQGFPESYKVKLRQVHAIYPKWKFVADHLDVEWQDAVTGETATGVNTVAPSAAEAWKSMDKNAYDWTEKTYEVFDSGGWVEAADNVVKYYLDPRNFLSSKGEIFQFFKMNYDKNLNTKESLEAAVKGTFLANKLRDDNSKTYVDVLMSAAEKSKVSPIALAAMIIVEQGSDGTGKCISGTEEKYKGYYNFFNIGAYESGGKSAVENGLIYAKNKGWDSEEEAIIGGAQFYADNYIAKGQNNLYYKKFNVVYKPYFSHQYMSNIQAAVHEAEKTAKGYEGLMDSELVFNIPVYKDMPESPMSEPTKTGNNDCYLSDISLNGINYTPTFDRYTEVYDARVSGDVSKVVVTPVKSSSGATVTGGGEITLNPGNNVVKITVKSTSGLVKTYTINVYRDATFDPNLADPEIKGTAYKIDRTYMTGILPSTKKEVFLANLKVEGGSARVSSADIIKSGDTVEILDKNGCLRETYTIFVQYDINCDGKCSLIDLSLIKAHLLKKSTLTGNKLLAADVNGDGKVSLNDLSRIKRKLLKIEG